MAAKRKVSAQTRVKLSQAAKKRQRGLKGTSLGGKFRATAHGLGAPTGVRRAGGTGESGGKRKPGGAPIGDNRSDVFTDNQSRQKLGRSKDAIGDDRNAYNATVIQELRKQGVVLPQVNMREPGDVRRVSADALSQAGKARQNVGWKTQPGLYGEAGVARGKYKPPAEFMGKLAPEHKAWVDEALKDPNSAFNKGLKTAADGQVENKTKGRISPGQRQRLTRYTNALQEGRTHPEALAAASSDNRGKNSAQGAARRQRTGLEPGVNRTQGRKSKYESVAPDGKKLKVGISSRGVDAATELANKYPNASKKELVRIQQFQREHLGAELQKNQQWAHETRRANLLGNKSTESSGDKIVFFTTNLGGPSPSVPVDSLVGQYIVRKRKQALRESNAANKSELRGAFPAAVRDQHVFEYSTGLSFGAEGTWGAFQKSGYRHGSKTSRNFGKPVPVGSQVLYDSVGRPIYDQQGNIRYSEGATRPFKFEQMKDVGLRVFIG